MAAGQAMELGSTEDALDKQALTQIHSLKTATLIRLSVYVGGLSAGASQGQLDALTTYGERFGLAFQIIDDLLDHEADARTVVLPGKTLPRKRPNYVAVNGLEQSQQVVRHLINEATQALNPLGRKANRLRAMACYLESRLALSRRLRKRQNRTQTVPSEL
jgi:geranylgeranyl pyrophosphate synthase